MVPAVGRRHRVGGFWGLVVVAVVAALCAAGSGAGAQPQPQPQRVPQPQSTGPVFEYVGDAVGGKLYAPSDTKLGSGLSELVQSTRSAAAADFLGAAGGVVQGSHVRSVVVTVRAQPGAVSGVASHLEALGAQVLNSGVDYVEARVSAGLLGRVSAHAGVVSVRLTDTARTDSTGSSDSSGSSDGAVVTSAAVEGIGADGWHAAGFDGGGVKVAVISWGFSSFDGLRGVEVPSAVTARCYSAVGVHTADFADCVSAHGHDHGTAVAEAVFDMAPGADYYIANPLSKGDLQSVVDWLIDEGVDVVHVSLDYTYDGPGDGTSPYGDSPLNAVDKAVAAGITWVQGAGNNGDMQWLWKYRDKNDNDLDDFVGQSDCNGVWLYEGETLVVQLRWDDDWGSSDIDLDLYLIDMRGRPLLDKDFNKLREFDLENEPVLAYSGDAQDGGAGQDPYEKITYVSGHEGIACAVVHLDSGDDKPDWMQLQIFSGRHPLYSNFQEWTLGNPAESINKGMLSVQAAFSCDVEEVWAEIELENSSWNPRNEILAEYSARGHPPGFKIGDNSFEDDWYYDASIINEVFSYAGCETRSVGEMHGTSQSSAFVAGMAALVLERFPDWGPVQVADYIRHSAHPVLLWEKTPNTDYGHGLAQLPDPPVAASNLAAAATDRSVTVSWDVPAQPDNVSISDMHLERLDADGGVERSVSVDFDLDSGEASSWDYRDYHFVDPGGAYRYRVRLETAGDGDVYSDVLEVTTPAASPSPPENLTASATHDTATLTWTVPAQPPWVSSPVTLWVMRERNGGRATQAGAVEWQRDKAGYTFTDSGLHPGQSYRYYIRAYMGSTLHTSAPVAVDTAAPTDPDADRSGAAALDAAAAADRVLYLYRDAHNQAFTLNKRSGDAVDYFSFTTTTRQDLMFEVRTDRIDLDAALEDAAGDTLARSADQSTRHDRIETLTATIDPGSYYIRVEAEQDGIAGYRIAFALTEPGTATAPQPAPGPLAGFSLVDASDQTLIAELTDGAVIALDDPDSGSYAIRADIADGMNTDSVSLHLTGPATAGPKTENHAPYSLHGDHHNNGARHLDGEALPTGQYTLTATAYSRNNLRGTEQGTLEISFTITN